MAAKKWVTIITFVISAISGIVAIPAHCNGCALLFNFSMAIFGSALLGFVMSLVEYFAERRKAMELFYKESFAILTQFRRMKYIDTDIPRKKIIDCLAEEKKNDFVSGFSDEIRNDLEMEYSYSARESLISWLEENEPITIVNEEELEEKYDEALRIAYLSKINSIKKQLHEAMDRYVEIADIELGELSTAYGNLNFLFGNSGARKNAYELIYNKFKEYRDKILQERFHFNMYKTGKGNFVVCTGKLFDLNNYFFDIKRNSTEDSAHTAVHQTKFYEISDALEDFRAQIYFKRSKEYEKRISVFSKMRRLHVVKNTEE